MTVNELIKTLQELPEDVRERDVLVDCECPRIEWTPSEVVMDDGDPLQMAPPYDDNQTRALLLF